MNSTVRLLACIGAATAATACVTSQEYGRLDIDQIPVFERELAAGVVTKTDIERIFGPPQATGEAVVPPEFATWDVWYYQSVFVDNFRFGEGTVLADAADRMLLLFFSDERLETYLWYGAEFDASAP